MTEPRQGFHVGTSGWDYPDWQGRFYPRDLPSKNHLEWYAKHFETAEVNYSFCQLPPPATHASRATQVAPHFVFAVKDSRFITHIKRLANVEEAWMTFLKNAWVLGEQLGPILLQFPPSFRMNKAVLGSFLEMNRELSKARPVKLALEFRHASWFAPDICEMLRKSEVALVFADSERYPQAPCVPTAPFVYLRFHGPGQFFSSSYSEDELRKWSVKIKGWLDAGRTVYAYFNNDFHAHAIANARTLLSLL